MTSISALDPERTAFVFPGQGSQVVGMGHDLAKAFPMAQRMVKGADATLGFALSDIMWSGPADKLNDTVNTQPALFLHSLAAFLVFQDMFPTFRPSILAGHSLGELSALTAGGALPLAEALRLVRRRGELMKRAGEKNPGKMAAVLGLDIPSLEKVCDSASTAAESVQVANDNSPGQVVISGAEPAVERAMALAKAAGAKRTIPLAISIAAHSALMATIQEEWDAAVVAAGLKDSSIPLIGNVEAAIISNGDELRRDIQRQMQSRVRWTETILKARERGISTFVEVGTGTVLLGLIKRIAPDATGVPLGTVEDFAAVQ